MNKARRNELKQLKYKSRLKQVGLLTQGLLKNPKHKGHNMTGYKNHGAPCSCFFCQQPDKRYNRAKVREEITQALTSSQFQYP